MSTDEVRITPTKHGKRAADAIELASCSRVGIMMQNELGNDLKHVLASGTICYDQELRWQGCTRIGE
jgi:hypothetical protein